MFVLRYFRVRETTNHCTLGFFVQNLYDAFIAIEIFIIYNTLVATN